jgi:hypothetical protein
MDVLGPIARVLEIKWDLLFRVAGSVIGVATAAGAVTGVTPLRAIAGFLGWAGAEAMTGPVEAAHLWVETRGDVIAIVALVAVLAGIITTTWDGRGAALAMVGIAALAENGIVVLPAVAVVLLIAVVVTWAVGRFAPEPVGGVVGSVGEWLARCFGELVAATAFVFALPVSWVAGRPARGWQY